MTALELKRLGTLALNCHRSQRKGEEVHWEDREMGRVGDLLELMDLLLVLRDQLIHVRVVLLREV